MEATNCQRVHLLADCPSVFGWQMVKFVVTELGTLPHDCLPTVDQVLVNCWLTGMLVVGSCSSQLSKFAVVNAFFISWDNLCFFFGIKRNKHTYNAVGDCVMGLSYLFKLPFIVQTVMVVSLTSTTPALLSHLTSTTTCVNNKWCN